MSIYKSYSKDEIDHLFSNYLVNSWSYSKLGQFSRNEKAFEMIHIYGHRSKQSATTVAGQAYHFALDRYFNAKQRGDQFDVADLEMLAFEYIEEVQPYLWKIQKTTPSIEDCKQKAYKTVVALIRNFFSELHVYEEEIAEVLEVEVFCDEFLTINGVDIPLPCKAKIDLKVKLKDGRIVIIDHKSKNAFSDEEALKLSIGVQAITYVKCSESNDGEIVDEVWFIENKYSQNKDKSSQLRPFKLAMTPDVRRLYEALIYESLKRMLEAVSDPDYVYLINDSDTLQDKAEIYDFWAKTMIAEVEDFNVHPDKKDLVAKRLRKIRDSSLASINPKVIKQFKENASSFIHYDLSNKNMTPSQKIEHILRSFGLIVSVEHIFDGFSSNTYLLRVSAGVTVNSVQGRRLDIANALDVSNVRISKDLVMHEGKAYLSIEFSKAREKDLIFCPGDLIERKIPIGKDNFGNTIIWNLNNHSTPHALVCGGTGSGKSVSIRSTIEYALQGAASEVIILDPKFEFIKYKNHAKVKVYNDILEIEDAMADAVKRMQECVKNGMHWDVLIIFDEFADAVDQARKGKQLIQKELQEIGTYVNGSAKMGLVTVGELKSLEENLKMILQKGRSVGMRVMAATQRASVKVISGDAKVNLPVQICFRVQKEADSRVVLDEAGAESLGGCGDGLIKSPEYRDTVRFQAYYCA